MCHFFGGVVQKEAVEKLLSLSGRWEGWGYLSVKRDVELASRAERYETRRVAHECHGCAAAAQ